MVHACVAPALLLLAALNKGARIDATKARSVECTVEWISALLKQPGEASALRGSVLEYFALCTTKDGEEYSMDPRDADEFEHGDLVSVTLGAPTGITGIGTTVYTVLSKELLHHQEADASMTRSNGYTALLIGTTWTDGYTSGAQSTIEKDFATAKQWISDASYSTLSITASYTMTQMDQRWGDAVQDCSKTARKDILNRTQNAGNYVYRMIFLPKGLSCGGWLGLATTACNPPYDAPRAGACWSMYLGESYPSLQGHELGHNFGLRHAGAIWGNAFDEYRDAKEIMGYSDPHPVTYGAANRYTNGWLRDTAGEVSTASSGRFVLSEINQTKSYPGASHVAIRIECPDCIPIDPENPDARGEDLFVSFVDGQVYVHLRKPMRGYPGRGGTEAWVWLNEGQYWENPYQSNVVRVCSISGNLATVGISNSKGGADLECSGGGGTYYVASGSRNCIESDRVLSEPECRTASEALSLPYNKKVADSNRPAGCFADTNGYSYFNSLNDTSPTWTYGICKEQ